MVYKLVFENLKHRPLRTLLSTLVIGVGVTMILTLVGISEGTLNEQRKRAKGIGADVFIMGSTSSVIGTGTASMNEGLLKFLEEQPHIKLATGTVVHSLGTFKTVTGADFEKFNRMNGGLKFLSGGPFSQADDILIDEFYSRQEKKKVGDKLTLLNRDWRVAGIYQSGNAARVLLPIKVVQDLTSTNGKLTMIYTKLDDTANTDAVIASLKSQLKDYKIFSMEELISQYTTAAVPELGVFTKVVIGLSVFFGALMVFLAMYTAVLERTREIGILKSLGATPAFVLGILLRETLIMSVLGAIFGIALSYVTRWVMIQLIPATFTQEIVYDWWPIAGLVTMVGALLGVIYPAWKAATQDTLESLSYD